MTPELSPDLWSSQWPIDSEHIHKHSYMKDSETGSTSPGKMCVVWRTFWSEASDCSTVSPQRFFT